MDQVLILLNASSPITARELAERPPLAGSGAQLYGGRILIAHLGSAEQAAVTALDGVAGVFSGEVPGAIEMPDDLAGRMAIEAWNSRLRSGGRARRGEGVAWDDPRFEREGRPGEGK